MKFLRAVLVLILFSTLVAAIVFTVRGFKQHWDWLLAFGQWINVYVFSEIVHTVFTKRPIPPPSSLAFQKEVMNRMKTYKL